MLIVAVSRAEAASPCGFAPHFPNDLSCVPLPPRSLFGRVASQFLFMYLLICLFIYLLIYLFIYCRRRVGPRRPGARCCADASAGAGPLAVGNRKHSQRVTCLSQTLRQFPKTQASVRVTRKPRRQSAEAPPGSPALATFGDAPPPRLQHRVQFTRRSASAFATERGT